MFRERECERERYTNRQFTQDDGWTSVTRRRSFQKQTARQPEIGRRTYQNRRREWEEAADRSIFIDNLPLFYERLLLKKLFTRVGKVSDSYVPGRRRMKSGTRYGFVCFGKVEEANLAIKKMDGVTLFGYKISVMKRLGGKSVPFPQNRATMAQCAKMCSDVKLQHSTGGKSYAEAVNPLKSTWVEKKKGKCDQNDDDMGMTASMEEKIGEVCSKVFTSKEWESLYDEQQMLRKMVATLEVRCRSLEQDMLRWKGCGNGVEEELDKFKKGEDVEEEEESTNKLNKNEKEDNISRNYDDVSAVPESTSDDDKNKYVTDVEDEDIEEEDDILNAKGGFGRTVDKIPVNDPLKRNIGEK